MYAGLSYNKQFLLQITDKTLKMFGDTRIKAACNRTGCVFAVRNRILTRKLRGIQAMRFCIFEIQGPSEADVEKCNRLIEKYFPDYKQRKDYSEKEVAVRLKVGQWTPDNTNLYFVSQRYGLGKGHTGDLQRMGPEDADGGIRQGNSVVETLARSLRQDWPGGSDLGSSGGGGGGGLGFHSANNFSRRGCGGGGRRSVSQGPQPQARRCRQPFDQDAVAAATAAGGFDGDGGGTQRYMGFREREAMLKSEIDRLESYLSNLQLV